MEPALGTLVVISTFLVGWLGLWGIVAIPLSLKLGWRPFQPTPPEQKLALLLPLYFLAPIVISIANQWLGQTWADQGWDWTISTLIDGVLGWGIAIAGLSLFVLLKQRLGLITFAASSTSPTVAGATILEPIVERLPAVLGFIVLGIAIGGAEEMVFRGWLQTQLEMVTVPWLAAIAASLLFALAHLVWDGRAGLWQQPGLWLLGMVLVWARWVDGGELALAWGLHAGWVSGLAYIGAFVQPLPVAHRPTWLAGRAEQPLTDVFDLALLVLTAISFTQFSGWLAMR